MSTNPNFDFPTVDFSGACGDSGEGINSATSSGMQLNQSATVNGGPVNNCVIGYDSSMVYNIWLTTSGGLYAYQIGVDAQGPSGIGYFHLAFTDATGDTYYLKIYSSKREQHTVDFNSSSPAIVKIWWSDYPFVVKTPNANEPDYKVAVPVQE